jgi:predicted RNA methylase
MLLELDKYYTPSSVATSIIEKSLFKSPRVCVDSTCGSGRLLEAAHNAFNNVKCVGLDKDKKVIASLKRKNPEWVLSVADLLNVNSYRQTRAYASQEGCDLLLLNPPFSHQGRKNIEISYMGTELKGSIAMAHILKSFELFNPKQGAIIIAPESLLYSETDSTARRILKNEYSIKTIGELESKTFRGARVHSVAIQLLRKEINIIDDSSEAINSLSTNALLTTKITRGNLAVFKFEATPYGRPFIHSTNLLELAKNSGACPLPIGTCTDKKLMSGWVLLLPRVGSPNINALKSFYLNQDVQISDCVISLSFAGKDASLEAEKRILAYWQEFSALYRGTGARYITLSRLKEWLMSKLIITN